MNVLDVVIVGIMGMSLLYSVWRGFVRDVFSLVGIVGGFLMAARFYPQAAQWARPWVSSPWLASAVGFVLLFLVVFVFVVLLGRLVWKVIRVLRLGWVDRLAGLGFGFIKGVFVCAGLVVVLEFFPSAEASLLTGSRLAPHVKQVARELGRQVPGQLGERFRKEQPPWKEPPQAEEGKKAGERLHD
jgi:membrane protein required for colicin V production